jgi:hypothetical protein
VEGVDVDATDRLGRTALHRAALATRTCLWGTLARRHRCKYIRTPSASEGGPTAASAGTPACAASLAHMSVESHIGVATAPGEMELTRMPSRRRLCSIVQPCFLARRTSRRQLPSGQIPAGCAGQFGFSLKVAAWDRRTRIACRASARSSPSEALSHECPHHHRSPSPPRHSESSRQITASVALLVSS